MSAKCILRGYTLLTPTSIRAILLIGKIPLKLTPKMLHFNWCKPPKAWNFSYKFHGTNLLLAEEFMISKKFLKA